MRVAQLITVAGHETTVAGISNTLAYLATAPETKTFLLERPELIPNAVEESLRYESPVLALGRTVRQKVLERMPGFHLADDAEIVWSTGLSRAAVSVPAAW